MAAAVAGAAASAPPCTGPGFRTANGSGGLWPPAVGTAPGCTPADCTPGGCTGSGGCTAPRGCTAAAARTAGTVGEFPGGGEQPAGRGEWPKAFSGIEGGV